MNKTMIYQNYLSRSSAKYIFAAAIIGDGDNHEWDGHELIKVKQEQNARADPNSVASYMFSTYCM